MIPTRHDPTDKILHVTMLHTTKLHIIMLHVTMLHITIVQVIIPYGSPSYVILQKCIYFALDHHLLVLSCKNASIFR